MLVVVTRVAAAAGADGRRLHPAARPQQPGGGFIAGLVIGVALIMQYMASGYAWAEQQMRIDYHALIGVGVLIAGAHRHRRLVRRPAVPHQRLRLLPPAADRRGRARHRHGVRPRRVPDRGRRGDADPGQPVARRPQGRAAARGRRRPMDIVLPPPPAGAAEMELLVASAVGVATAVGIYLVLRAQTFPVVLGPDLPVLRGQRLPVRHGPAGGRPAADHQPRRPRATPTPCRRRWC